MKYFLNNSMLFICILTVSIFASEGIRFGAEAADAGYNSGTAEERSGAEIDDRALQVKSGHSCLKVLSIDLLIPGGGHFYLGNYYSGALFAGLKITGAFALYYFYNDLEKKRDEYHSIQDDSSAGKNQIEGQRREYESAHENVMFAAIGTAAVYLSSLIFNYADLKIFNERSIPAFEYKYSLDPGTSGRGHEFFFAFNLRV